MAVCGSLSCVMAVCRTSFASTVIMFCECGSLVVVCALLIRRSTESVLCVQSSYITYQCVIGALSGDYCSCLGVMARGDHAEDSVRAIEGASPLRFESNITPRVLYLQQVKRT